MKKILCVISIISIINLEYITTAVATPTSLGIGVNWTDSPYKGYGSSFSPIPHIDYDNEVLFIDDLSAGIYTYHDEQQSISIGASYLSNEFKPHNSDNQQLKKLDKRHPTILAQIEYSATTSWGIFSSSLATDVLNNSNSILINTDYSAPIIDGHLIIVPTIGINWANNHHNNYYYGVSHKESYRSGLRYHKANNSFTPYAELNAQYPLTANIYTFGGVHVDKLTGDVADSPMIANSIVTSIYIGIAYNF